MSLLVIHVDETLDYITNKFFIVDNSTEPWES
jgi:hypothetical protein